MPMKIPADWPFFAKQKKLVLAESGTLNPEKIESYISRGGYTAIGQALREMTPEEVCATMVKSGLRGRGGAGFPTGLKWGMVRKAPGERKYVVANGDEGDPGAYMDRTLMESDPHRVLEGMAIAGFAVGADQGFIYVRGEYPLAAKRLEKAIRQAERKGLLAPAYWTATSISESISAWAQAHSCAARKRRSCSRSWDAAGSRYPARLILQTADCGAARP